MLHKRLKKAAATFLAVILLLNAMSINILAYEASSYLQEQSKWNDILIVGDTAVKSNAMKIKKVYGNPYKLMYDSNEKLAERIDGALDFFMEEQSLNDERFVPSDGKQADSEKAQKEKAVDKEIVKEVILGLVRAGKSDEIADLEISDKVKNQVNEVNEEVKEDRFIVKYSSGSKGNLSNLLSEKSAKNDVLKSKRFGDMEVLVLNEKTNPKDFADKLKNAGADEYIEYIQPDFRMEYASISGDPVASRPGGEDDGPGAGYASKMLDDKKRGNESDNQLSEVIVAIIDTGIDITHLGLTDYIWNNANEIPYDGVDNDGNGYIDDMDGWNFYGDNSLVYDSSSPIQSAHGTHIAGIVSTQAADYDVKIMPLKVFGSNGAYTSYIIDAIEYAEANGARIANCSFGSTDNNPALEEAMANSGMLFVCAVGNARSNLDETPIYPACFDLDNIISVTSTNADGGLSYYSNYSINLIDIAARGRDVNSTLPGGEYGLQSGTSMAAAQVSGAAAAVLCVQSDLVASDLRAQIITTADMLSNLQTTVTGGRQLNIENAVQSIVQTQIIQNAPEDNFDVNGYDPTQDELYGLYSNSGDVIQVAAAGRSSVAGTLVLKENGTVWAWGNNPYINETGNTVQYSPLTQVIGLSDIVQIDGGYFHGLALKSDGTVWAWGSNGYGNLGDGTTITRFVPVQVSGLSRVVSVVAGDLHSMALKDDGTVWAWGHNQYGQLGNGTATTTVYRPTPVQVSGSGYVAISAEYYLSLALKSNGTVWAWGDNTHGQLGDGTKTLRTSPVQVRNLTDMVSIAAGSNHGLAIKKDGTVWAWGYNGYGQLGDGTTTSRLTPVQTSELTKVVEVAAGDGHCLALKEDGTVWGWGLNSNGQLGDGTSTNRNIPVQTGLTGVVRIASGCTYSIAVKKDGTVWGWGENTVGQLGGDVPPYSRTPVQASGLSNVVSVASGLFYHNLALKEDGTVWGWGDNNNGQLGEGARYISPPTQISGLTDVVSVAAGPFNSIAAKEDGTVWTWGLWVTGNNSTPIQVSGLSNVVSVAAGYLLNLALKSDGTVWAWGANNYGEVGDGTTSSRGTPVQVYGLSDVVSIAAGYSYSLALKSDGTVWAWGYNYYGQLGDGSTTSRATPVRVSSLTDVSQIAAGHQSGYALKSDGTVRAWGDNYYGQLGDGTTTLRTTPVRVSGLNDVVSVAGAGYGNALAAKSDGTVWAWGNNSQGQLGDGSTTSSTTPVQVSNLTDAVTVAGGMQHGLTMEEDGTIWSWGNDLYGQLGRRIVLSETPIQCQTDHNVVQNLLQPRRKLAVTEANGKLYAIGGYGTGYSALTEEYNYINDTWTSKAAMITAREGLGAASVDDNIYAIGGYDGTDYLDSVEAYSISADSWTSMESMPTARTDLSVIAVNGKIYALGGYDGTDFLNTVEEYNPNSNTWTTKQSMITARSDFGVAEINGIIYAIGGRDGSGALAAVEAYDPVLNQWTTVSSLSTARYGLGAANLNNQIVAVGGYDGSDYLDISEVYDPNKEIWELKSGSLNPRAKFDAAILAGNVYLVGGENQEGYLAESEIYNLGAITWSGLATIPTGRSGLGVVAVDDILYAIGGYLSGYKNTVEAYDPSSNTWTSKKNMLYVRKDLGVTAVNEKIYAVGGFNGGYSSVVEEYDPSTNTWATKAAMPTAKCSFGIASIRGKVYVIGGYNGSFLNTVQEYDPSTNTWATKANMPTARRDLTAVVINGKIYAIGGFNGTNTLATVEVYDPVTDTWMAAADMLTARRCLGSIALNGRIYAMGGYNGLSNYNVVEEYNPSTNTWTARDGLPNFNCSFGTDVVDGQIYIIGGSPYLNYNKTITGSYSAIDKLAAQVHLGEEAVNPSGNLSRKYTDMSINSPGFQINLSRTYNSGYEADGPFGKGWTFGFEGFISDYETDQKIIRMPDGSVMTFTFDGSGYVANDSRASLVKNADNTFTLTTKDQYSYGFDSIGWLRWMKDPSGNIINITVNQATGLVTQITYLTDKVINITYDAQNHISAITDPAGRTVTYEYENNRLVRAFNPMGKATRYSYDANGYLNQVCDHDFNVIESIVYDDSLGDGFTRIAAITDVYGNTTTYSYDTEYRTVTTVDSNGRQTIQWFDSTLYPVVTQDPETRRSTTLYNLDSFGNNKYGEVLSETDRNGNRTQYDRDANGNVTKIYHPDSSYQEYGYDSYNNVIWEKDEDGKYTFYIYDANGIHLIKKVQPLNGTDQYTSGCDESDFAVTNFTYYTDAEASQFGYYAKGLLKTETNPEGGVSTYTYDADGNILTVTNTENKTTSYTYNQIGWKLTETTPKGYVTSYVYDSNGNVEKITLNGGETTRITYDNMCRKSKSISANKYDSTQDDLSGHAYNADAGYRYTYYASGKVHTVTDPCDNVTTYAYDLYGNLVEETKPNGGIYIYSYDSLNRLASKSFKSDAQAGPVVLSTYSYLILSNGNTKKTITEFFDTTDVAVTSYTYDYAGRQVRLDQADGTFTTNLYNANGTLASATDARGNTTYYAYDGLNRQTNKWTPIENQTFAFSAVEYDKAGRVTKVSKAEGAVAYGVVPTTDIIWTSYTYNANGTVLQELSSSGSKALYAYDDDGNVSSMDTYYNASEYKHIGYTYNYFNKATEKQETVENQDVTGYDNTSDALILTTSYTHDANGNVLSTTDANGTTITYTYDSMNRRLTTSQPGLDETGAVVTITTSKTYDWAGNVLTSTDELGRVTSYAYDTREFLTQVTDALDGMQYYTYDRAGRKTVAVTPNNYLANTDLSNLSRTEYTYDDMNRLLLETQVYYDEETSSWEQFVSKAYTYDENGNVTKAQDALGYQNNYGTLYEYDKANRLIKERDPESQLAALSFSKLYSYDAIGRVITETDANGNVTVNTYDDNGKMLTKTVDGVLVQTNTYDLQGNLLTTTDGNGNTTTYTYNHLNMVRSMTLPGDINIDSCSVIYRYTKLGQIAEQLDSMGKQVIYTYDNQGRMLTATEQKSDATQAITVSYQYDKAGNLRYQADGNGNMASYTYDALNRKISAIIDVTDCEDNTATQTTTYGYDANGNLTSEQNWRGNSYSYVYDALNRLIEKTDPNGETIEELVYNDNSAQVYSIDALNNITEFVYDRNGRLTETIDALGKSQYQYYDGAGNVIHAEDANGNDTYYTYDGLNRLTAVINALNETTSYTYDYVGNRLTQTDGKGNITTIQYNCRNLPTMRIDAGGILADQTIDETKATSYTYYANGNAATQTDRNGLTTSYTYDIHGRLLSQSAGTDTIIYTYDNNGNQLTVTNSTGTITREYDELDRVISKDIAGQGAFTYQYDVTTGIPTYFTGQITTDPKGNVSTRVYDRVGRLYQVIAGTDTTTYTYFDNGTRESITYPNGLTAEYTYYANNKLHTLANKNGSTIIEAFNYSYDDNGNMSSKLDGKGTTSFTYDALNRLATVTEPDGTVTEYTYDAAGNRTGEAVTLNGVTTSIAYTYNVQNRLTATEKGLSGGQTETIDYFYDNNGNTVSTQVHSIEDAAYDYDGFNQLAEATQDGSTMQMAYSGEGLRVSKELSVNGQSSVVQYLYEYNKVVLELNGNGEQAAYNLYGNDTLISRETGGEKLYYLYNGHGDVTALTDGTGAVVASYYYDAFGNITEETGSANNSVNYAGYQYDAETGMYYLNARYYNPVTARFLTEDTYYGSVYDPLSLNLYTYCANNPIIYWDPTGHVVTDWDLEHCSASEIATIIAATEAWNAANAAGDTAAMDAAHQAAVDARSGNLSAGQSVGDEGYVYDQYTDYWDDYDYYIPATGGSEAVYSNVSDVRNLATAVIGKLVKDIVKTIGSKSTDEITNGNSVGKYLESSLEQVVYGNYSDKVNLLGTGTQIGMGLLGIDFIADARDVWYDVTHFEPSWEHVGQTALDAVGLIPLIGVLKNADEVGALIKGASKSADDVVQGTLKTINDILPSKVTREGLANVAITPGKGGVTPIGRAFQKHAGNAQRAGAFTGEVTGNISKNTEQGMKYLNQILDNPNSTAVVRNANAYGNVLDIRMPDGTGVRFSADGNRFIGFLEKYTPTK